MGSALLNNVHRKDLVIRQVGNKDVDKQTVLVGIVLFKTRSSCYG